jgi:hypothetical protein
LQLAQLGRDLSVILSHYESVSAVSSRTVAQRVQHASSDYWKAVKFYSNDEFDKARRLVSAGALEIKFIKQLLEAETTERELGESVFFEFATEKDQVRVEQISSSLELASIEILSFLAECKKARGQ